MEKSVLALLVSFAVVNCASGDNHARDGPKQIPPENIPFLAHPGARSDHPDSRVSNLSTTQPWNTSSIARLQDFTSSQDSNLEVRPRNATKNEFLNASDRARRERFLQSNGIDVVQENEFGSPGEDHTRQWKLNRRHGERRTRGNTAAVPPVRDSGSESFQLSCSLQSELGLVVRDASCAVAAAASASCALFHTRGIEDDLVPIDLKFDFSSSETHWPSAFGKNEAVSGSGGQFAASEGSRRKRRPLPSELSSGSRAVDKPGSEEGTHNLKAAVVVRSARSATTEDLTLWISAPPVTVKSTYGSHDAKSAADVLPDGRTSSCWQVKFRPALGWSESLLHVQGLPVQEGRYSAWVMTGDHEVVLAQHAVDVVFSGDQQNALKIQTVSNANPVPASRALQPSQSEEIYEDDDENIFFHSSEDDAEDLSTTSDPWRLPVVERPFLSQDLHLSRKFADKLEVQFAHLKKNLSSTNFSESSPLFYGENGTYSKVSQDSASGIGDLSSPVFHDVELMKPRMKRSLECKECVKKMRLEHEYDAATAIFVLKLVFNCSMENCCRECSGPVNMQQYQDSISASKCSTLPISVQSFRLLYPVADAGYISVDSPYTMKLPTGCYLATVDLGEQAHWGFTWLQPNIEPPDLNAWNTTFYLQPRPLQREVRVRWTQPQYPQNFSRYSLQLWYQADRPLDCSGYHTDSGDMMQVQPTPSLPLDEPEGVFEALSPGWYCARVTPLDPRCPRDGCAVRASHAVLLEDPSAPLSISTTSEYPPEETDHRTTLIAAIIGALLFVVLVTALVAFLRFKWVGRSRLSAAGPVYHKVSQVQSLPSERPCLLLVWTKRADSKGRHAAAVAALRRLLSTHFVVWDYLDLLSLPPLERDKVLENPAGWLYTAVHNPRVKVVVVSSVGAEQWRRVVQEGSYTDTVAAPHTDASMPLDVQLFPYLLQLLLHDPALVADYSKIFVVRFARVFSTDSAPTDGGGEGDLGGLVQGLRYSLPSHLGLLSAALLGASKKQLKEDSHLSYPRTLLEEFEEACQVLAVPDTQPSSNFVIADRPSSKAKLSNGSVKTYRLSENELC